MLDIEKIYSTFTANYTMLYDAHDNYPDYASLVDEGDRALADLPDVVRALAERRQDYITSDREAAALALTVRQLALAVA